MDRILEIINMWDPIEMFPMAPKDEYFHEVEQIKEFIYSNQYLKVETLAQEINRIFMRSFGNGVYHDDIERCNAIAKEILESLRATPMTVKEDR